MREGRWCKSGRIIVLADITLNGHNDVSIITSSTMDTEMYRNRFVHAYAKLFRINLVFNKFLLMDDNDLRHRTTPVTDYIEGK